MVEGRKDITLDEMVERLASESDKHLSRSALSVWLRRRGWTFKTYGSPRLQATFPASQSAPTYPVSGAMIVPAKMELSRVPILIRPWRRAPFF